MPAALPPKITKPFAWNAGGGFIQSPLPATPGATGRANYQEGFPPINMQPIIAGGVPPFGQDFNGLNYAITSYIVNYQAGNLMAYDAQTATDIAGYGSGAILKSADGASLWWNNVSGNTSDPDAGGAGWAPLFGYGHQSVPIADGANTLTALQSRRTVIVLTGALTGNAQVIMPTWLTSWLIVNATTGGFAVTVKPAAGTGVDVPAGGYSAPVGVYGDGTNIYPTVSPLAYPIAEAPNPSTIPLRTNIGALVATYFNMSGGVQDLAISNFFAETAGDGYLRKMSPAWFAAQLFAMFSPSKSLAANGWLSLPGGVLIQWGFQSFGDLSSGAYANVRSVTFPTPYLFAAPFVVFTSPVNDATAATSFSRFLSPGGFQLVMEEYAGRSQGLNCGAFWLAIGQG